MSPAAPAAQGASASLTKHEYAYVEVRRRILSGELEPGSVIPQAALAAELGVSTTPLREAIKRLSADGLIELAAHRDAHVAPVTRAEAEQLYEVRQQLDPFAAGLAAQRRSSRDLTRIADALARLEPITDSGDTEAMLAHREFHRAIYSACGNELLVDSLDRLWDKADRYRALVLTREPLSEADRDRIDSEHQAIVGAVIERDGERARRVMREHIAASHGRRALDMLP